MEVLMFIFVGTIAVITAYSVWYIYKNITFKKQPNRFKYVLVLDEDGNHYEKVVDYSDNYEEESKG